MRAYLYSSEYPVQSSHFYSVYDGGRDTEEQRMPKDVAMYEQYSKISMIWAYTLLKLSLGRLHGDGVYERQKLYGVLLCTYYGVHLQIGHCTPYSVPLFVFSPPVSTARSAIGALPKLAAPRFVQTSVALADEVGVRFPVPESQPYSLRKAGVNSLLIPAFSLLHVRASSSTS